VTPPPEPAQKAGAHLAGAIEAFLLSRRVGNCSSRTLEIYAANLGRFQRTIGVSTLEEIKPLAAQHYLTGLRERMKPVNAHQHFRTLMTFFIWFLEAELLQASPMRGLKMKPPKTLRRVPEDDHVRRLLRACPDTFEGRRNRGMVALRWQGPEGWGGFFGAEAAQCLRVWLARRSDAKPEDSLFVDRVGRSLARHTATHILHRLSAKAELPRKIGPHALRHYAATAILRQTGDLELVRQVLRHESLAMALRYAHPTKPDVSAKFRRASPLDNLRAGR